MANANGTINAVRVNEDNLTYLKDFFKGTNMEDIPDVAMSIYRESGLATWIVEDLPYSPFGGRYSCISEMSFILMPELIEVPRFPTEPV